MSHVTEHSFNTSQQYNLYHIMIKYITDCTRKKIKGSPLVKIRLEEV
jgi:hypothetical protein